MGGGFFMGDYFKFKAFLPCSHLKITTSLGATHG